MTTLQTIQKFAQQTAIAIAAVLGVEVVMIDDQLRIVAGTGIYGREIGLYLGPSTVSARVVELRERIIVTNPRLNSICQSCSRQGSCPDHAEICLPIVVGDGVIGVLALVALNEEQKMTLLEQEGKLVEFVARVSELLGSAISARQLTDALNDMATEYKTVINSVNDGIIAVDTAGMIKQVNGSAEKMLMMSQKRLIGKKVTEIFSDATIAKALQQKTDVIGREIVAEMQRKKHYFWANLTHISEKNSGLKGHVLVIRNVSEVRRMVGSYLMQERTVQFDDIKCVGSTMIAVKDKAQHISKSDSTVLIQGESGTGKEMFARAIHSASPRFEGPFVAINCGAIPESLLESELFGYEEGAFSGARRGGKAGRLELADKGTIFLDEIGDLPLHLQVKLLRIFETKVVDRVGGIRPIPIDVRIIAATHRDLQAMVARGEFREDLYYRLNVIPLFIPALRDRREDIRVFTDFFIKKFNDIMGKQISGCSPEAQEKLFTWDWPGNVRELENAIEYSINMEQTDLTRVASLPSRLTENQTPDRKAAETVIVPLAEMEKRAIINALEKYGTSSDGKKAVCRKLGIGIATLYRKIKAYKINLHSYRPGGPN